MGFPRAKPLAGWFATAAFSNVFEKAGRSATEVSTHAWKPRLGGAGQSPAAPPSLSLCKKDPRAKERTGLWYGLGYCAVVASGMRLREEIIVWAMGA